MTNYLTADRLVFEEMGVPTVTPEGIVSWRGSSMVPPTVVSLLNSTAFIGKGFGVSTLVSGQIRGTQGSLDVLVTTGTIIRGVVATGSITTVGGASLVDGETFTVSDGVTPVIFEFHNGLTVPFSSLDTAADVRDAMLTSVGLHDADVLAYAGASTQAVFINLSGNVTLSETVTNPGFVATNNNAGSITTVAGGSLIDGQTFTITDGHLFPLIFEFDSNSSITAGNIRVPFMAGDSATTMRNSISTAISTASRGTIVTVAGASLVDGETFTLNDGVNPPVIFEFDSNSSVTPGHVAVVFTGGDSVTTVRDAMIAAINGVVLLSIRSAILTSSSLKLVSPVSSTAAITETVANAGFTVAGMTLMTASGIAVYNATSSRLVLTNGTSSLTLAETVVDIGFLTTSGGTITTVAGSSLVEGETFTVDNEVTPIVFEFTNSTTVSVPFSGADTTTAVRNAIVAAIMGSSLNLTASNGGAAVVNLANNAGGAAGNVAITDTVVDVGFTHTGMSGGVTASLPLTVVFLTDDYPANLHCICISLDDLNRPFIQITNNTGTLEAETTPSGSAIGVGQPIAIHLAWDSAHVVSGTRYASMKVNGVDIPDGEWSTNPTTAWTPFQPTSLVAGAAVQVSQGDFDGTIDAIQVSNLSV